LPSKVVMPKIEDILVIGAGAIGCEIALQCAMFGYRVTLYDISAEILRERRAILEVLARKLAGSYVPDTAAAILERIYYTTDLEEAAATADLVSESAPEDPDLKRRLFARLGELAQPQAIFTTNSSSFPPSLFADASGRPDRFLALHFHKTVWIANLADVMAHPGTRPEVVEAVAAFARSIGQTPIVLAKESAGYIFNAMQRAYVGAALELWVDGVASFEDIDRAWMIAEGTDHGPFGVMDFIGLETVRQVMHWNGVRSNDPKYARGAETLQTRFIDKGHLGIRTGQGFYRYPDPAYRAPDFIAGRPTEAEGPGVADLGGASHASAKIG
jgi:3-hydroxybutyryl-CoA dehydrogenase